MSKGMHEDAIQEALRVVEQVRTGAISISAARLEINHYLVEPSPTPMIKAQRVRFDSFLNAALRFIDSVEMHPKDLQSKKLSMVVWRL
ncbi:MAG: hypothetical protein LC776_11285 [Acidobacteria bacterium]|nr:hypothetical protein [Acidobacteriota bacterium]